jgi:hypothetical protein
MNQDLLTDFLDHRKQRRAQIEQCVDKGVTERPPIEGVTYVAFVVHPPYPANLLALAIAHRADKFILDVIREDISVADASAVMRRYGISEVTGAEGDKSDALAHAALGAFSLLGKGQSHRTTVWGDR